jgi:hypothetical protein
VEQGETQWNPTPIFDEVVSELSDPVPDRTAAGQAGRQGQAAQQGQHGQVAHAGRSQSSGAHRRPEPDDAMPVGAEAAYR